MYFWLAAGAVFILDRLVKLWVITHFHLLESKALIEGIFSFTYVRNYGAAFGILSGHRWLFLLVASVTILAMVILNHIYRPGIFFQLVLGLVAGGAVGNMFDRFYYGSVIDFISVGSFPIFNVADMAIVGGCAGLFLFIMSNREGA